MADWILNHDMRAMLRLLFGFKTALCLACGVLSFVTDDVSPSWVLAVAFLAAAALYLYEMVTLSEHGLAVASALVLSVGAALFRSLALTWGFVHGDVRLDGGHFGFGVTLLLGVAGFSLISTAFAASQLGTRRARCGG